MNVKQKWGNISSRDKSMIIGLIFVAILGAIYFGYSNLSLQRDDLNTSNDLLTAEQDRVNSVLLSIKSSEAKLKANEADTATLFDEIPDSTDSAITFERQMHTWLVDSKAKVLSFNSTTPQLEALDPKIPEEFTYPMIEKGKALEAEPKSAEEKPKGDKEKDGAEEDPVETTKSKKKKESMAQMMTSTYTYELELTQASYKTLIDNINRLPEYQHMQMSSYTTGETGLGVAKIEVKVYAYDKPALFKIREDLSYFTGNGPSEDAYNNSKGNNINKDK